MRKFIVSMTLLCLAVSWSYGSHLCKSMQGLLNKPHSNSNVVSEFIDNRCNRYMLDNIYIQNNIVRLLDISNQELLCIVSNRSDSKEVVLFNAQTTSIEWSYGLEATGDIQARFTPEKVFISYLDRIICLKRGNGNLLWETNIKHPRLYGSNITLYKDYLYIPSKLHFSCYNSKNGLLLWEKRYHEFKDDPKDEVFVIKYNDTLFLKKSNHLYKIDAITGETIWSYRFDQDYGYMFNIVAFNNCIVTCAWDVAYMYIKIENGEMIKRGDEYIFICPPIVVGDFLYIAGWSDNLMKINKELKVVWRTKIDYETDMESSNYIVSDGSNIIVSGFERVFIINADTSNIVQKLENESFIGAIFIEETHNLYTGSDNGLRCFSPAYDSITYTINSNTYNPDNDEPRVMDTEPVIANGRTLLPARYVVEPLGGQVFWDGDERKVTCKLVAPDNPGTGEYKENVVELWIDKPTAKVNGVEVQIDPDNPDVVPTIINDRTMVPMRFLAESLGCEVEWIPDTKEIILTYGQGG